MDRNTAGRRENVLAGKNLIARADAAPAGSRDLAGFEIGIWLLECPDSWLTEMPERALTASSPGLIA
jgi:hypothetical protein